MRRLFLLVLCLAVTACGSITTKDPDNNAEPVASASDVGAITQVPVTFDGSASSDSDGFIVSWAWTYGDGNTGSGEFATHTYDTEGNYEVTLVVRDNGQKEHGTRITAAVQPITALAGSWTLSPDPTAPPICQNNTQSYAVPFPAPTLDVTINGTMVDGVAGITGTTLSGQFDGDGDLAMVGNSVDSNAGCGSATVQENMNVTFLDAGSFEGVYTIQFEWTNVFCNCSQIFDVAGSK